MEYYNNTLCITGKELILSEENPKGIVSKANYDNWVKRDKIKVLNRACYGNPAIIEFNSIPARYRDEWKEKNDVDPEEKVHIDVFMENYLYDEAAASFYGDHIVEYGEGLNNKGLDPEVQQEYTYNASVLNAIRKTKEMCETERKMRNIPRFKDFWQRASRSMQIFHEKGIMHTLPENPRRLMDKYKLYLNGGYIELIHKNYAQRVAAKINDEAGEWILAQWMSQIDRVTLEQLFVRYNKKAETMPEWKAIKTEVTLRNYLYRPEIQRIWYAARHGELAAKELYSRQNRTILPNKRDSLWYSDGTKLNYYYKDAQGNILTCNVYEVMDVYSERMLGYHISKTEDFEAQYHAYKMALQTSGQSPYEIRFDNQGGHKKLQNGDLLNNLARHAIRTAPYNGKSKTIESAFGRFQAEFLHKDWFFTGQNIGSKKQESRANMEFILANAGKLPTLEEIKETYKKRRDEWNAAPHPKSKEGVSRNQMYLTSENEACKKLNELDIISIFGIMTDKPATYTAAGITLEIKGKEYPFEVLTPTGEPDKDFNRRNIGRKFYRRYCPEDLSAVALYEKDASGMRFIAYAQPYLMVHRALQDQVKVDHLRIRSNQVANKDERIQDEVHRAQILEKHGLHPNQHGLNTAPLKGITSGKKQKKDIGQHLKEESNRMAAQDAIEKEQRKKAKREARDEQKEAEQKQSDYMDYLRRKRELQTVTLN
jgi:hypothetical protein